MKVLFIAKGDLPDYQADTIMHGGRSMLGSDFVDANFAWYMYKKERQLYWNQRVPDGGNSYGRGMTLHGTLDECVVDRQNIEDKIRDRYFDFVIYASATRCNDYFPLVSKHYPIEKIVLVDGEDDQNIRSELYGNGMLFKRELVHSNQKNLFPVSFGAPKEKIVTNVPEKTQDWATVIPGRMETYIFTEEKPYYEDYQKSYFALTHKKGGWDCMRHYEILLNGCVPYFPDITACPPETMTYFPKELCKKGIGIIESQEINESYFNLANDLLNYTKERLTTDCVFNSIAEKIV
jgi:hypothetical protein